MNLKHPPPLHVRERESMGICRKCDADPSVSPGCCECEPPRIGIVKSSPAVAARVTSISDRVEAFDAVKVPEAEWDSTPEILREPYVEAMRKSGYVYGIAKRA